MNYENKLIITCEFMAAKVFLLLFCATTIIVELCIAVETDEAIRKIPAEIKFLAEPEDVVVVPGQNATFQCSISLTGGIEEKPTYQWKFNDELIMKKSKTLIVNTSTAKKKKKEKEGVYQCFVSTTFGSLNSRSARLKIADVPPPFAEKAPSLINASEGDNVRLSCELNSVPDAQITWYARNAPVSTNNEKYLISSKYLYVNNITKSDAGEYRCQENNLGSQGVAHLSFILSVESPKPDSKLDFISPELPKNLTVKRGNKLSLHCHANKANALVRWAQVEMIDRGGTVSRPTTSRSGYYTLEFDEVKENKYKYSCIAEDPKKPDEAKVQENVNITVGEVPKIDGITSSRRIETMGIPVRFQCNVSGYPEPTIRWFHNGDELIPNRDHRRTIKSNYLVLRNIEYGDRGVYQCLAENEFGATSSATILEIEPVENVPSKVTGVQCTPINTTDITITFNYSQDPNAPPVQMSGENAFFPSQLEEGERIVQAGEMFSDVFLVQYYREDNITDNYAASTTNGSITLGKLQPDTKYTFVVKRYNGRQGSEGSDKVSCSTKSDQDQTLKVIDHRIFSNAVILSWRRSDALRFKVVAKNVADPKDVFQRETNNTFIVLSNLTFEAEYQVDVNSYPKRNAYEPTTITMNPIEPKPMFQFYKINESSVVFLWMLNKIPKLLNGFQIKYKQYGQQSVAKEAYLLHNETSFIVHNLSPGELYEVSLFVVVGNEMGNETAEIDRLVFKMALDKPQGTLVPPRLACSVVNSSEIRLMWFYAQDYEKPLHLVKFGMNGSNDMELKVTDAKNFIFRGLTGNTEYKMSVRLFSEKDENSNYSEPLVCKTHATVDLVPGRVFNMSFSQVNSDTAYLSWQRPDIFDEFANRYVVSYGIRDQSAGKEPGMNMQVINSTKIIVAGDTNSVYIPKLVADKEYVIMIRVENPKTGVKVDSPQKIIVLEHREAKEEDNEKLIGLIMGGSIGLVFILVCVVLAIFGKKILKKYYYKRTDPKRSLPTYRPKKKQDNIKILAKNSTVFKNSAAYGNGTNLQLPLLSNGTYVNGGVQITNIEGVRYCPGSGIRSIKYENDMLLNCDSPTDETYTTMLEVTDPERDHEGGDSGYCDKNHSQSPPLKDYTGRRHRKSSDIATDDGFHESSEVYTNGSSPV